MNKESKLLITALICGKQIQKSDSDLIETQEFVQGNIFYTMYVSKGLAFTKKKRGKRWKEKNMISWMNALIVM